MARSFLRDELCIVMFDLVQQAVLAPLQEACQRLVRVRADLHQVSVGPHLQTHQHHTQPNRAIQLVHVVGNLEHSGLHQFPVTKLLVLQQEKGRVDVDKTL